MSENRKDDPMVRNAPYIPSELWQQIKTAKANAQEKPNMFPQAGKLGETLTEQVQAQAKQDADELPLMSQAEMLSVLLTCHEMLAESMKQLTETMAAVLEMQKGHGE